ncbi:MAG: hypothetical protein JNL79_02660 [Myxococcales bacterium]|nr:hypothetical protein [Myxococcales bacterium]
MRSLRSTACALGLGALVGPLAPSALSAAPPPVPIGCVLESVRVSVIDEVDDSWVEVGVRLRASGAPTASCTIDFTQIALGTPDAVGPTPTIALAATWVAGKPVPPLLTADGVAAVSLRSWSGEVTATPTVVSTRLLVEGTGLGLRVELPRTALPGLAHGGARVERRAKSARPATGRFGPLGTIEVPPTPPGLSGGVGPTSPLSDARTIVEVVPSGAPATQPLSPAVRTFDALRQTLPLRALDLGESDPAGWDELAKRAYAAALHGDPLVAALGMRTLAWFASGLSLQAVRVAKTAAPPETVAVPASVVDAIGDVEARLAKRHSAVGRLLPLGRPAVFRKILEGRPWADAPRAKAAKDAVERLAPLGAADLTAFLVPPMLDGASLPIDPPAPADAPLVAVPPAVGDNPVVTPPNPNGPSIQQAPRRKTGKRAGLGLLLVLVGVGIARLLREDD